MAENKICFTMLLLPCDVKSVLVALRTSIISQITDFFYKGLINVTKVQITESTSAAFRASHFDFISSFKFFLSKNTDYLYYH
jgi:hypothetical protein